MAVAFNALFGSNQSKTAGTSLNINPTDITVATGDDIFLSYAGDDIGSAFGVTDGGTASITWTQEKEQINTGAVKSQLWRGNATAGGTLTDITISWTTNVTAKAAVAGWFSGVGTRDYNDGQNATAADCFGVDVAGSTAWQAADLVISANGYEGPNGDDLVFGGLNTTGETAEVGQNGTTGGGAASNITASLTYMIPTSDASAGDNRVGAHNNTSSARNNAGAGAVYSPAAVGPAASLLIPPQLPQLTRYQF